MNIELILETVEALTLEQLHVDPPVVVVSNPVDLTAVIIRAIVARLRVGRTYMSIKKESKELLPNNKSLSLAQIAAVDTARLARIAELTEEE